MARLGPVLDLGEEDLGPAPSGLEQLLADGRQTDVVGGLDVVVADDRHVVWDMQSGLARGRDDAERLGIARREDRRRPVAVVQHPAGESARLVSTVRAVPEPLRRDRDAGRAELRVKPASRSVLDVNPNGLLTASPMNPIAAMTELQQMSGGKRAAGDVVADDAGHVGDGWRVDIDEDNRDRRPGEDGNHVGARAEGT